MDDLGVPLVLETSIWKQECHCWTWTSGEIGGGLGWWFGILGVPLSNNSFLQGDLRNPNHKPKPKNNESLAEESNSKKNSLLIQLVPMMDSNCTPLLTIPFGSRKQSTFKFHCKHFFPRRDDVMSHHNMAPWIYWLYWLPWELTTFIFRGYITHILGMKTFIFHGFGVQRYTLYIIILSVTHFWVAYKTSCLAYERWRHICDLIVDWRSLKSNFQDLVP